MRKVKIVIKLKTLKTKVQEKNIKDLQLLCMRSALDDSITLSGKTSICFRHL